MAKENTYRVICKTDLYHVCRYPAFNKHTGIKVCETGLTLKEAQSSLLEILNMLLELDGYQQIKRWRKKSPDYRMYLHSFSDGTRAFSHDVFIYSIEREDSEND